MSYQDYFLQRDPIESTEYAAVYQEVRAQIDLDLLENLPRMSFLMLKPDAYLRGLMPDIVSAFSNHGIVVTTSHLVQLDDDLIDHLYMFVKTKYASSWWVMEKIYTLAPSYPMLVVGSPESFPHLSARIRELIGPTTPIAGRPGQLRYDFRATHRVSNLIHATDDPAAAIREALVFFKWADIKQALSAASELGHQTNILALANSPNLTQLRPEKSLDLTYSRVLYRAKGHLYDRLHALNATLDGLFDSELTRFQQLRQDEEKVLGHELSLREEQQFLSLVNTAQLAFVCLLRQKCNAQITTLTRARSYLDKSAISLNQIARIAQVLAILLAPAPDILTVDFEVEVLGELAALSVELDSYDAAMLHAKASAIGQEVRDLAFALPVP